MTKISWRDANASDLKIEYEDGAMDNGILQPGRRAHVGIMMRDAAKFCDTCVGSGKIKDASIKCPVCGGSGLVNSLGQGISPEEVTRAMTTHHESARNGTFGSTDSNSQLNDHLVRDAEIRRAAAPHRAWRITDQSRAHHARMNDDYQRNVRVRSCMRPVVAWRITSVAMSDQRITSGPVDLICTKRTVGRRAASQIAAASAASFLLRLT
jgi:hypothetical protein